ncbi:hypothetical protein [Gemella haemolysans]|uniref:hypothetical protein n=1 Tax=Gemella haemolysans TaxID=1379 RepID=UPI000551693D|nr:hypothetical protein [Gemella haemolysans]
MKCKSIVLTTLRFSSAFLTSSSTFATVSLSAFLTEKLDAFTVELSNETLISSDEPFSTTLATNVSLRDAELTISLSFDASSLFTSLSVAILAKATFLSSSNFAFSISALAAASFSNLSFSSRSASAF